MKLMGSTPKRWGESAPVWHAYFGGGGGRLRRSATCIGSWAGCTGVSFSRDCSGVFGRGVGVLNALHAGRGVL